MTETQIDDYCRSHSDSSLHRRRVHCPPPPLPRCLARREGTWKRITARRVATAAHCQGHRGARTPTISALLAPFLASHLSLGQNESETKAKRELRSRTFFVFFWCQSSSTTMRAATCTQ
jgi:hypothetical protein